MISVHWSTAAKTPDLHQSLIEYVDHGIGGTGRGFGECVCMAVFDDGSLSGAVVFHNWNPEAQVIEISAASESPRWLARKALYRMFAYAFDECECQMVVARISEDNKALHSVFHRYGFKSYLIPRLRGRNEDERLFTLTDDDWRSSKFNRKAGG